MLGEIRLTSTYTLVRRTLMALSFFYRIAYLVVSWRVGVLLASLWYNSAGVVCTEVIISGPCGGRLRLERSLDTPCSLADFQRRKEMAL